MDYLKRYCERYGEDYRTCLVLFNYYKKIGWSKTRAVEYIKDLIVSGALKDIRELK